jgi:unsaturated chondroitin disaccharide hydrolase
MRFLPAALTMALLASAPEIRGDDLDRKVNHALQFAHRQLTAAVDSLGDSLRYPRYSGLDGRWDFTPPSGWTSGFFPGCLWLMHDWTKDDSLRGAARRWTAGLAEQRVNTRTHDIGFIMYCSYGNAYRLDGKASDRETLLESARTLARRFNPAVGCIKSWDWSKVWQCPVIIDNMMNLELLLWASKNGGEDSLRQIALTHALHTRRNHFRPDASTYHVVNYDSVNGSVIGKVTHQGSADESVWARGQAWAIYGFTMMYRETGDERFLETAERAARYFIEHLPPDGVPYWDFMAPGIPNAERDASAAAIAASGLIELSGLTKKAESRILFLSSTQKILSSLTSPAYLAEGTRSKGILNHAVGNMPRNAEVDVSLIYGDYYFLEALIRYQRLTSPK